MDRATRPVFRPPRPAGYAAGARSSGESAIAADTVVFAVGNVLIEWDPRHLYRKLLPDEVAVGRFRAIVVSAHEGLLKLDAAIYRLLLDRHGLSAGQCLFVDDSAANVAGAEAVGMRAHLFRGAPALRAELRGLGLLAE
jgi:2-haloacid dehalogenase